MKRYEGSPAIVIERRKGTPDSPFSDMNETLVVAGDGKVVLSEIPNELNRVIVTSDDNITWYEITNGQVPLNGFKVDYINKLVTFNIAHVGKQLHFKYFGEGNHYYSLHSIYTKLEKGSVVETLGDLIENGTGALDALDKLDEKLNEVNQATNNAITVTNDARDIINEGNQVINTVNNKITEIDNKNDEATSKILELDSKLDEARTTIADVQQKSNIVDGIITDGQTVIDNVQTLIDEVKSVGEFNLTSFYKKNNTVLNNGSTWIALQDTQNNPLPILPVTENTYWRLTALHGLKGDKGETGTALSILGKLTDVTQLPPTGQAGDGYTVNGELYVWSENTNAWENVGNIKGEKGDKGEIGEDGRSAYEVAVDNGFVGTIEDWFASLKGERGDKGQDADLTDVNQEIANLQQTVTDNKLEVNKYFENSTKIFINAANPPAPLNSMKFDEQTDDTVALQNIINYLETKGGGSILFPQGISLISSKIVIKKPIFLIGQGKGGNSDNTNGSGIGNTTFRWSTLQSGTMFEFVSETPSSTLFDGGMSNILLDGGSTATRGFKCKSCGYMDFKSIEGRSFVSELGLIDDSNGVLSQFNRFEDIKYVYGAGVDTQNSHGLVFHGVSEIGVTQNHIISITGLMHSGYLLVFKTSDNNVVEKCHSATIGTGGSIWFANGIYSDSHLINYLVGRVKSDSMAKGNRIVHWNSEGGGLDITEGSVIHYEVYDYYQCNLFTTRKYIMTDQKNLTIGDFDIVDGGAIKGIAANQWSCINLPDNATDSRISCIVPPEYEWYDGTINTLRIRFSQDSENSGGRFRITIKASTSSNNGGVHLLEYDASTLVPANTFPYTNQHIDIPINLEYKKDDLILISITRNGSHTEDTAIGNMQIIGAQLIYNSVGPNSSGSGSYPIR